MPESNSSTDNGFVVGRLGRPHGLDGYLGLYVDEADRIYFDPGNTVTIESRPYLVRAVRRADRGYQVQFDGVMDRESADEIRGREITVVERRHLAEDEYWPEQLAGLDVKDGEGNRLGTVRRWVAGSAQDRLLLDVGGVEFEVPFVTEFIPVVDLDGGFLEIRPIPGLIEPLA